MLHANFLAAHAQRARALEQEAYDVVAAEAVDEMLALRKAQQLHMRRKRLDIRLLQAVILRRNRVREEAQQCLVHFVAQLAAAPVDLLVARRVVRQLVERARAERPHEFAAAAWRVLEQID
eukprot:89118-Prymnesium_polylepis.3